MLVTNQKPKLETQVSLADVLDPFSQTVSTKNDGKPYDPKDIDALVALLKPPACAVSGVSYLCGQTPSSTPPVGIDLTTLAKGDVLGIYDYAVLVTQVSKGSSPFEGKGLVKLPFAGNITVPVTFKGIKAKKGEDGTQGGCVWYVPSDLTEGYFQVKGSQQDAIVKEQEKLLADIYSELIDPQSFYGTFEEALAKYEVKSKEIACKLGQLPAAECAGIPSTPAPTADDYKELVKYLHGVVKGDSDWKEKLLKHLSADASKPEMKVLLNELDKIKKDLEDCEKCVTASYSKGTTAGGKGGPMMGDDFIFTVSDCKIETGIGDKLTDILDKTKLFLGTEKPGDIVFKLIGAVREARSTKKATVDLAPIIKKGVKNAWGLPTEKLDEINHKTYPAPLNTKLPNGKKISFLQVDVDDAIWKKDEIVAPYQVGVVDVNFIERKLKGDYTALMFTDPATKKNTFWVTVKDEDVANMKEYLSGPKFPVSGEDLHKIFTSTSQARCDEVAVLLNKYSDKFEINTPLRMSHFLGQVGHETGGFAKGGTGEWTCYKEEGKWSIWYGLTWKETPFSTDCSDAPDESKRKDRIKKNTWKKLSDVPKKYRCKAGEVSESEAGKNLFSYVYRCEGGNGDEASEDGYKYRGHGFIHLTWKRQYNSFNTFLVGLGYDSDYKKIISDPDEAFENMEISCLSGMWYWKLNGCNESADDATVESATFDEDIKKISLKINAKAENQTNRVTVFKNAYKVLKK